VDAKQVGIGGLSRYDKAALVHIYHSVSAVAEWPAVYQS